VDPATRKAPIVESGVTAVYDRHSYDLEKRAALDFWGRRLEAIISCLSMHVGSWAMSAWNPH
jgi:hypothetical protein